MPDAHKDIRFALPLTFRVCVPPLLVAAHLFLTCFLFLAALSSKSLNLPYSRTHRPQLILCGVRRAARDHYLRHRDYQDIAPSRFLLLLHLYRFHYLLGGWKTSLYNLCPDPGRSRSLSSVLIRTIAIHCLHSSRYTLSYPLVTSCAHKSCWVITLLLLWHTSSSQRGPPD